MTAVTKLDYWCAENSEARLGKDVPYKLLVRALNETTNEELAQLVSQSFSVSTFCTTLFSDSFHL